MKAPVPVWGHHFSNKKIGKAYLTVRHHSVNPNAMLYGLSGVLTNMQTKLLTKPIPFTFIRGGYYYFTRRVPKDFVLDRLFAFQMSLGY